MWARERRRLSRQLHPNCDCAIAWIRHPHTPCELVPRDSFAGLGAIGSVGRRFLQRDHGHDSSASAHA